VSNWLASVATKLQTALSAHQQTIAEENKQKTLDVIGGAVAAIPGETPLVKGIKAVGGLGSKLFEASAVEQTAVKLTNVSKEKLLANFVISAAQVGGQQPTITNLPLITTQLTNALTITLDNTITAWRNWLDNPSTDKKKGVPFDPSD